MGVPPLFFFLSDVPGGSESDRRMSSIFFDNITRESKEKIDSILKYRKEIQEIQKPQVSVAGEPGNIWPASFLQVGATRSLPVCRIARFFSMAEFKVFLEGIKSIIKEQGDNNNFDSLQKLKEIFLIPDQIAEEIFGLTKLSSGSEFLDVLENVSESVLSKLNPIPWGTGFLVGGSHLLTNWHVITDKAVSSQCVAQFNYIDNDQGNIKSSDYELDAETFFVSEQELDYTLVQLKAGSLVQQAGYKFGWIQLIEDDERVVPEDSIFIIQHPKGKEKGIDLIDSRVIKDGLYKNFLRYQAHTDYGSSGSPVFDKEWELVALHHAVVPIPKQDSSSEKNNILTNQGIRTCRIVEDLKKKSYSNPKLRSFIEDFVVTSEQLNYPPLPAALEFDGKQSYVSLSGAIAFASVDKIDDNTSHIKCWSQNGLEAQQLKLSEPINEVCISPNGKMIALSTQASSKSGCSTSSIKLWQVDGTEVKPWIDNQTSTDNQTYFKCLCFSPDGTLLAAAINHTIWLGSIEEVQKIDILEDQEREGVVTSLYFSPDGKVLVSVNHDGTIKLWSVSERKIIKKLPGDDIRVLSVSLSPDGTMLASGRDDRKVILWDTKNWSRHFISGAPAPVMSVSFSPDGQTLTIASSNGSIANWPINLSNSSLLFSTFFETTSGGPFKDLKVYFSSDGKSLISVYVPSEEKSLTVQFWDVSNLDLLSTLSVVGEMISFSPDWYDRETENLQSLHNLMAFTIEAWVNPYPGVKKACIVGSINNDNDLQKSGIPGQVRLRIDDFREGSGQPTGETYAGEAKTFGKELEQYNRLPLGKFSHVAFVFTTERDGTGYERIYINGYLTKSTTKSLGGWSRRDTVRTLDLTLPVVLGATLHPSKGTHGVIVQTLEDFFTGGIAEVRLWKTALEETQIQANLYRRLNGDESGLIGYWRLDEGEGSKVYNLAPELNSYGLIRSARWLNASQINSIPLPMGLKFSEADDHVNCGHAQTPNATGAAITIEAWVKHKFGNCVIVSQRDNNQSGYSLSWIDGRVQVALQGENSTQSSQSESSVENIIVATSETVPQDQMWHHIAFTWKQQMQKQTQSGEISIYIDGKLQDCVLVGEGKSKTIVSARRTQTIGLFSGPLNNLTSDIIIGRKEEKKNYYNVTITEVRLWRVARTQDQIKSNMSRRLSERDPDWNELIGYWRLDEGSSSEARNLKSPESPGKIFGATPFPSPPVTTPSEPSTPTETPVPPLTISD